MDSKQQNKIYQSNKSITTTWITPKHIYEPLGDFDLDPCVPAVAPWHIAKQVYSLPQQDGLILPWHGRVWLNPPYTGITEWMKKMAAHACGIALTFARTDTRWFQEWIFPFADSILFLKSRISFYDIHGNVEKRGRSTAPSVLISYGEQNTQALAGCGLKGRHIMVNATPVIIVGISPSWKCIITIAVGRLNGKAALQAIYDMVETIAPDKVKKNKHFKEKVRQTAQIHLTKISRGLYATSNS